MELGGFGSVTKALANLTGSASCSGFDGRLEKTDRLGWKERTVVPLVDRPFLPDFLSYAVASRARAQPAVLSDRTAFARERRGAVRRGGASAGIIIAAADAADAAAEISVLHSSSVVRPRPSVVCGSPGPRCKICN